MHYSKTVRGSEPLPKKKVLEEKKSRWATAIDNLIIPVCIIAVIWTGWLYIG